MSIRTPKNINFLAPIGFDFSIKRLPNVEYFVQSANIPGISSTPANEGSPFNVIKYQPDHISFGDFSVEFIVDEDMKSWTEIYQWMIGMTFPESFQQYADFKNGVKNPYPSNRQNPPGDIYSDASLIVLTNKSNLNIEFSLYDIYPISLTPIRLQTTESDIKYLTAEVTFVYQHFNITVTRS